MVRGVDGLQHEARRVGCHVEVGAAPQHALVRPVSSALDLPVAPVDAAERKEEDGVSWRTNGNGTDRYTPIGLRKNGEGIERKTPLGLRQNGEGKDRT